MFISDLLKIVKGKAAENSVHPQFTFFVSRSAWVGEGYPTTALIIISTLLQLHRNFVPELYLTSAGVFDLDKTGLYPIWGNFFVGGCPII